MVFEAIIKAGIDVNCNSNYGSNSVSIYLRYNMEQNEIIQILITAGFDLRHLEESEMNKFNSNNQCVLTVK